nr:reverse transcriptase domain-containing protein [Tanacetum cinerariifolium]
MSTRSNSSHLFSPLRDLKSLIRRRILGEPSSLFDFEEVMNNNQNLEPPPQNGPPPMVRPNGHLNDGGVMNSIHSFDDMMRKFLSEYFPPSMVTKLRNEITKFEQKSYKSLFETRERYKLSIDRCPNHNLLLVTQIDTFYNGLTLIHRDTVNVVTGGTFRQKTPEECYELIENMTAHNNHWDTSAIRDETSRNISSTSTSESLEVVRQLEMMNKNFSEMMRQFQTIKAVDMKCETCGGPHSFTGYPTIGGYTQETAYAITGRGNNLNQAPTYQAPTHQPQVIPQARIHFLATPNPREDLKVITTRSGVTLAGPSVSFSSSSKEVDRELETITEQVLTKSTNNVPPLAVQPPPASTYVYNNSSSKMPEVTKDTVQPNPRVPLILGRPFLRTGRALIDVNGKELTPRVDDEAITFKVGQTSKYSYNDVESINQVDVIDVACEEYVQEILGFSDNPKKKIEACLTSELIPSGVNDTDLDLEGDIRLLEELLKNDPSLSPLPPKELNAEEIKSIKSSIDETPKLELKELPSHLEYAYLEGADKLPVIIVKDLKVDEKEALLKKLTEAPILVVPDWNLPFELMCDASDFAIGAVLGKQNLAADNLSRLENPHKDVLENKDINENLPLETLEAMALPTNDARVVVKILKSLFARFRTPRAIIIDRGTHFCNEKFAKVMLKYGVTHRLSTAYHPQTSGQVEVLNQGLKRILERTVGENRASWSEKLEDVYGLLGLLSRHPLGALLTSLSFTYRVRT